MKISSLEVEGNAGNYSYNQDHFTQTSALYNLLPSEEKGNLISNIAAFLGQAKNQEIIVCQIDLFTGVNPGYGARVAQATKQQA